MDIVGRSHVGQVRSSNEDYLVVDSGLKLAVLADGMGGLAAGEVASHAAAEEIRRRAREVADRDEPWLRAAFAAANERVLRLSKAPAAAPMGTTLVVWCDAAHGQCFVAHVGDSRAYRLRAGKLDALTEDHSVVQQMVSDGVLSEAEARFAPERNVITRAIGLEDRVEVDVRSWVRGAGDVFLLCSDGLTDMLTEAEVLALLRAHLDERGEGDLEPAAEALVDAANAAGGVDNVSVVLLRPSWPPGP